MRDNGEAIDVRIQGRVAREPDGELVLYAVVSDVTAELRDQRERSWQNERYRLLSEMTHKMSFDYDSDSDTVLLYMDRTGKGMEAQVIPHYLETLSETRGKIIHPGSMDDVRRMFQHARSGANEVSAESAVPCGKRRDDGVEQPYRHAGSGCLGARRRIGAAAQRVRRARYRRLQVGERHVRSH